jgi:hypothetical protein
MDVRLRGGMNVRASEYQFELCVRSTQYSAFRTLQQNLIVLSEKIFAENQNNP